MAKKPKLNPAMYYWCANPKKRAWLGKLANYCSTRQCPFFKCRRKR